jgi:predicted dehydrogenase
MSRLHRRQFMKTLAAAATVTIAGTKSTGRVLGANDAVRAAVIGIGGRGGAHVQELSRIEGVQITYLIDPEQRTYAQRLRTLQNQNPAPRTVADARQALDDRNLDVVSIATPNHWHALMTIWAAQAGKHVYVEKPSSHNVKEGRITVEAARRHNVLVQHGTQSRSNSSWANTVEHVKSGRYGRLLVARGLCYKLRPSIGQVGPQGGDIPESLDYNLWCGPAPVQRPLRRTRLHYDWHWIWDYGNGDIGNQGVHQMDIARWGIAGATLPRSVMSVGGRFGYTDDGETANTQISIMDFGQTQLIFEVRGLPSEQGSGRTPKYRGQDVGNFFHTEQGVLTNGRFFPRGEGEGEPLPRLERAERPGGGNHFANFIAAVRNRRREDLNADILEGHYSSALGHLANISYRLGQEAPFNQRARAFGDNREAQEALERMAEHLGANRVALDGLMYRVGRKIDIDAALENTPRDEEASRLLTRPYRAPFIVPDRIA